MSENLGKTVKVSGPLVVAQGLTAPKMYEVVKVSAEKLIGEIIEINGDEVSIQVYEDTSMIGPGDPVVATGDTMTVDLAPGLLEGVFDGIQRPLSKIEEEANSCYITRGIDVDSLAQT